jgi:hypothetical protein
MIPSPSRASSCLRGFLCDPCHLSRTKARRHEEAKDRIQIPWTKGRSGAQTTGVKIDIGTCPAMTGRLPNANPSEGGTYARNALPQVPNDCGDHPICRSEGTSILRLKPSLGLSEPRPFRAGAPNPGAKAAGRRCHSASPQDRGPDVRSIDLHMLLRVFASSCDYNSVHPLQNPMGTKSHQSRFNPIRLFCMLPR